MTQSLLPFAALALASSLLVSSLTGCKAPDRPVAGVHEAVFAFSDDGQYLPRSAGRGAVLSETSPIPDVPLPIGFKVVASKSRSSVGEGGVRTVQHYYQGRVSVVDLMTFYKQQLWRHDWQAEEVPTFHADGPTFMRFTKGPEDLEFRLTEFNGVATLIASIVPTGARVIYPD